MTSLGPSSLFLLLDYLLERAFETDPSPCVRGWGTCYTKIGLLGLKSILLADLHDASGCLCELKRKCTIRRMLAQRPPVELEHQRRREEAARKAHLFHFGPNASAQSALRELLAQQHPHEGYGHERASGLDKDEAGEHGVVDAFSTVASSLQKPVRSLARSKRSNGSDYVLLS